LTRSSCFTSREGEPHEHDDTTQRSVQGEGDYEAGRRYDKASREFAESGKVEPAAHDSTGIAEELERAEEEGKSHSKGEGPLVSNKRNAGA
jgi:hypothetical protein